MICKECGQHFEKRRQGGFFCNTVCRRDFNNRRQMRGAELYDVFMGIRYERDRSKELNLWTLACRMAEHWKAQDDAQRAGRKSWGDMRDVRERHVPLLHDVRIRNYRAGR